MGKKNRGYDSDLKERLTVLLMLYLDGLSEEHQLLLRKKVKKNLHAVLKYYSALKRDKDIAESAGHVIALKIASVVPVVQPPETLADPSFSTSTSDGTT